MNALFTIGHSTHPVERIVELLRQHEITALCDVRSRPYSRWNPQFNRETFKQTLADNGIAYVFLGKELGGRPEDPARFAEGMRRLEEGAGRYRVAILCAEKDPVDCHRALLVGREARERGWTVNHILADGRLETQDEVMARV